MSREYEKWKAEVIANPPPELPATDIAARFWAGFDGNHAKRGPCRTVQRAAWEAGKYCRQNLEAETLKKRNP